MPGDAVQRLVQFVFLVVWVIGAVTGGLTVQSPASDRAEEPSHVLMDASHARLSVARERIVLTVGAPRWSEWQLSVPLPEPFLSRFSHERRSETQEAVQDAICAPQAMPRIVEEET